MCVKGEGSMLCMVGEERCAAVSGTKQAKINVSLPTTKVTSPSLAPHAETHRRVSCLCSKGEDFSVKETMRPGGEWLLGEGSGC